MSNPTKEYEYVIIDTEDKRRVFSPKNPRTDQIWRCGGWLESIMSPDGEFWDNEIYRRRILPGEGYEIVPIGEAWRKDTSTTCDGINWKTFAQWYHDGGSETSLAWRKPLKQPATPPVESTWREIGDLEGVKNTRWIILGEVNKKHGEDTFQWHESEFPIPSGFTHWQPISPVPKPKPMTEEEALKALLDPLDTIAKHEALAGWNAHIAYLKKGGGK